MEADGDLLRPVSKDKTQKTKTFTRKLRLDSKGRILLPADLRKNFDLGEDSEISIVFRLDKNLVLLEIGQNGQDSVMGSTRACGKPFSEKLKQKSESLQRALSPGANPGPDPENIEKRGEKYG